MKFHFHRSRIALGAVSLIGASLLLAHQVQAVTIDQPILEINPNP